MKQIIKSHTDIFTVPETLANMKKDYEQDGYNCELLGNLLKINLDDGYVMIFWENGAFYQECHEFDEKYLIWKTNKFDDNILTECVATFYNFDSAKDFVDYQATLGEGFAITINGKRVEL